jgi:phospholipase/carboxylesterase
MADLGFVHVFKKGSTPDTLLLLHGTGGDEHDMLPLGGLMPGANLLSPRGQVLEQGMPRFFRRLAEGVFDIDDLKARAGDLARFITAAAGEYGFDARRVYAMGFSNGANIASAVALLHPGVLRGIVLFRGMVPLEPDPLPALPDFRALISNGSSDPIVSTAETERLARLLQRAGADVELHWQPAGHQLMPADFNAARTWLDAARAAIS